MRYRIYFNRAADAPQVWSVDEGSHASEVNVQGVQVAGNVPLATAHNLDAQEPEPKAWMEAEGQLVVRGGVAVIVPDRVGNAGQVGALPAETR